jgi:hypothetical protein
MLFATREILLEKLLKLPALIDAYQRNDVGFVERSNHWLQELEQSLNQLRNPLTSKVANERGRVISALEGYRDPALNGGRVSRRKAVNVTTSLALSEVETVLVAQIQDIDGKFDLWREKLAQFISVASGMVPIPLPPTDPRQDWLKQIWANWKTIEETRAMFNYLNTVMSPSDRLQLLGELLDNHLNGNGNGN